MPETLPLHVVRTRELRPEEATHVRHPLNPSSEIFIHALSRRAGMKRAHLNLARVPPGKESFIPHSHALQEEFIFVLEGEGTVTIGGVAVAVGPGDYIGFPTDGVAHHLVNSGARDLVYLMGGEHTNVEVAQYPSIGKVGVFDLGIGVLNIYDTESAEAISLAAWTAKK